MNLYYESSDGTVIDFMSNGIYAQSPETLLTNSWSYNTISGTNGIGLIKEFYKEIQELQLKLSVITSTDKEFNALMYNLHRTFDRDVRRMQPGKLWWNGFYKEIFAVEMTHSEFEELFETIDIDIKFISVNPYWIKKRTFNYMAFSGTVGSLDYGSDGFYAGFDYGGPFYAGFDYDISEIIEVVNNDCIYDANFEIIFYGPAESQSVVIGNHEYEVYCSLDLGEYITVNSVTKKIIKHANNGNTENVFAYRNKESYIFEKIAEGITSISRSKETGLDISIFDERGEPEWI